jgi:RhtB (resistance to homoserine/threonine) family protein
MIDSQILAFTGIAAILTITPGSDTMLVMRSVLTRGQRAGLLTTFGICCGVFIHAVLSSLGLSWIIVRSSVAFETLKMLGACYLIFLGCQSLWQAFRDSHHDQTGGAGDAGPVPRLAGRKAFIEGMLNNVLNPKVAVFYLAFLPQFISPGDPVLAKSVLLAGIHFTMGIIWLSLVTFLLGRMQVFLSRPRVKRGLEAATGFVLIGFGLSLAAEKR